MLERLSSPSFASSVRDTSLPHTSDLFEFSTVASWWSSRSVTPCYLFFTWTLVSLGDFVDTFSTKFDLCEFRRLFKDPMKDFLAVSLVFVF